MKTTTLLAHLLIMGSLLGPAADQVVAQAPGGGAGRGGGFLTQDQRAKMRETMQASQSELTQLNEKLAAAQKEAIKAVLAKNPDEKAVRAKIEAVAKIQTDIAMLRLKAVKEIAPTLTDEQKTQIESRPGMAYGMLLGGSGGMGPGGPGGGRGGRGAGGGGNN
jgi:Spy/CpxP family protein refolding chaperone